MTRDDIQEKLLFAFEVFKFRLSDRSLSEQGSSRLVLLFACVQIDYNVLG